jgi:hypothetical protein
MIQGYAENHIVQRMKYRISEQLTVDVHGLKSDIHAHHA